MTNERRAPVVAAVLAVAVLAIVSPPARAEAVLAGEGLPTAVTAYRGHVVWSSYGGRTRGYRLKHWFRGRTRLLPLASRLNAFDADLGPGPDGRPTLVYSRCRFDAGGNLKGGEGRFAPYDESRGCNLYLYRLGSPHERRLPVRGERRASEYLPTIWRGRVAFARRFERRRGRGGLYPYLYTAGLSGRAVPRRLPGGTRGLYPNTSFDDTPSYEGGPGPVALDLRGGRLAFAWAAQLSRCGPDDEEDFPLLLSEMWFETIGRPARRVEFGCAGDDTAWLTSPSLGSGSLAYYQQRNTTSSARGSHLHTFTLASGQIADTPLPAHTLTATRDGRWIYYVRFARGSSRRAIIARVATG